MMKPDLLFFWLVIGHIICDYPLQGEWMARAKQPNFRLEHEDISGGVMWMHAFVHGAAVLFVTNSIFLAGLEIFAHYILDTVKCYGKIKYNTDQFLHLCCKLVWVILFWAGVA